MTEAVAQTAAAGGDWFAMVKRHHAMIADTLNELTTTTLSMGQRKVALNKLAYQLTAHGTAEENVLYPALALHGMMDGADKLYMEQAHAKVKNAEIDMDVMSGADAAQWLNKAGALQKAILEHAKQHEEGDLFPKLQQKLDADQNRMLTAGYAKMFDAVKPVEVV